jgi:TPR repeat protein
MEYSDWGDVARLSCVQSSWKPLLWDAAHANENAKWQCANALLDGTNGLAKNPKMAVLLLQELAGPVDWSVLPSNDQSPQEPNNNDGDLDVTIMELADSVDDDENHTHSYRALAMRRLAEFYLNGSASSATIAAATAALPITNTETSSEENTTNPTTTVTPTPIGLWWLQAAFDIGKDVTAAHDVAVLLEKGQEQHGIAIDVVASGRWFFKAARAGHVESMAELALLFELGIGGMVQSDEHALFWYRQAALRGHSNSKYSVGEALEEARGVPHSDVEEACLWYYKAALDGDEDGKLALQRLADVATRMRLVPLVVEEAPAGALLDE